MPKGPAGREQYPAHPLCPVFGARLRPHGVVERTPLK